MTGNAQASRRKDEAISRARLAVEDLRKVGVEAMIVGSLARGTFGIWSDVDFLVTDCPPDLKYAIEGRVEDRLRDFAFDVVYLDEIPIHKRAAFIESAIDACRLR